MKNMMMFEYWNQVIGVNLAAAVYMIDTLYWYKTTKIERDGEKWCVRTHKMMSRRLGSITIPEHASLWRPIHYLIPENWNSIRVGFILLFSGLKSDEDGSPLTLHVHNVHTPARILLVFH